MFGILSRKGLRLNMFHLACFCIFSLYWRWHLLLGQRDIFEAQRGRCQLSGNTRPESWELCISLHNTGYHWCHPSLWRWHTPWPSPRILSIIYCTQVRPLKSSTVSTTELDEQETLLSADHRVGWAGNFTQRWSQGVYHLFGPSNWESNRLERQQKDNRTTAVSVDSLYKLYGISDDLLISVQ